MALNPKTLKSLFKNLVPYADDVVKGVAKYGDDAASMASNYGTDLARYAKNFELDDILKTVNTRAKTPITGLGDDFVELGGKAIHYPTGGSAQDALKGRLLANRTGLSDLSRTASDLNDLVPLENPPMSVTLMERMSDEFASLGTMPLSEMASTPSGASSARTANTFVRPSTYALGDVSITHPRAGVPHIYPKYSGEFTYLSDDAGYELPLSELVLDSSINSPIHVRPHKNTALYRWYDKAKKLPF